MDIIIDSNRNITFNLKKHTLDKAYEYLAKNWHKFPKEVQANPFPIDKIMGEYVFHPEWKAHGDLPEGLSKFLAGDIVHVFGSLRKIKSTKNGHIRTMGNGLIRQEKATLVQR